MPNLSDVCMPGSAFKSSFDSYITQCLTNDERTRASSLISSDDIKTMFTNEAAIQNDLLTSLNGIKDLNAANVGVSPSLTTDKLTKELANINQKIQDNNKQIEVQNQKFLQSITSAPKSTHLLANYQDVALMFFFGSMLLFTIVVSIIQFSKKDGSLKAAISIFVPMIVVMIVTYGLLKEVA